MVVVGIAGAGNARKEWLRMDGWTDGWVDGWTLVDGRRTAQWESLIHLHDYNKPMVIRFLEISDYKTTQSNMQ